MNGINKHIVVATLGLIAIGVVKHNNSPNTPLTPVLIGGYVFMLALSVLDLFGGQASQLASGLAMVALVGGALTELDAATLASITHTSTSFKAVGSSPGGTGATP